jgi:hypothetical protein
MMKLNQIGFQAKFVGTGEKFKFTFDDLYGYEGEVNGVFLKENYAAITYNEESREPGVNADIEILAVEVGGEVVWSAETGQ